MAEEQIYRLLVEGFCASQIATKLNKTKGYISRIIRRLEKGGYILCINPKERPRFYTATNKQFIREKFTPLTPTKQTRLSHRLVYVEIQKSSFICQVLSSPSKAKWDKNYIWRPGVEVFQFSHPFKDFGLVVFRRFKSKNKDKLLVILPRLLVHKDDVVKAESILLSYARLSAGWIKRVFDMPISPPVPCQKPHYATPCREPEIVHVLQKKSFKIGEMMADTSPPDMIPEIESTDGRDVVNYLDSINKIKWIEEKLLNNEVLLRELLDKMDMVTNNQSSIINVLNKSFSLEQPRTLKDDSFIDVA